MSRPLRIQYPGACYHITCRGNERRNIFVDSKDQSIFLKKLSLSLEIYNVELLAYVMMPNHFHLMVSTPDGNLSDFMRHFNISYTSVFNRRHKRVGHLYQGRYKAFLLDADSYLLEVSRYIHLNPVRTRKYLNRAVDERWRILYISEASSLAGYFNKSKKKEFINYNKVLDYMGGDNRKGREAYRRFIKSGLKKELENPLNLGKGSGIVGDPDFVDWIKKTFLRTEPSHREQPALKELRKTFDPEKLIEQFSELAGIKKEELCRKGKSGHERAMLMEMLYRFCNIRQPEIGKLVGGIDYSAVSQSRKRLLIGMKRDKKLKNRFDKLHNRLSALSAGNK
ncbi:transposase [Thermodesulfobacteriota bacterium]